MGISNSFQWMLGLLLPESLGESLFHGINMGYQVSFWMGQDVGEALQTKLTHCFSDLSGSRCSAGNQVRTMLLLSAYWLPTMAFCFPHFDQVLPFLRGNRVNVPKHRFYWREIDSSTITFSPWEFSLRSFISWAPQGKDMSRSFWEFRKSFGNPRSTIRSPSPAQLFVRKMTDSMICESIFYVAQWWRRVKGRHFVSEKIVCHTETLEVRLKQYFIWIIWGDYC